MVVQKIDTPPNSLEDFLSGNRVYFNGFTLGIANADVSIVLKMDNTPHLHLKASYTTVKTLAMKLGEVIADFEAATDHKLMTTDEIGKAMEKTVEAQKGAKA